MEASGHKAAFLGREDGSFEAWVYPMKVLHDFKLSFGVAAYADPIPGASLAADVDVRPEASTVRYAHASFTVDATWLVPLDEQGGIVLLDVTTSEPLTVVVKFRHRSEADVARGARRPVQLLGQRPQGLRRGRRQPARRRRWSARPSRVDPPEQPAHNLPDAPSQFAITITPEIAAQGPRAHRHRVQRRRTSRRRRRRRTRSCSTSAAVPVPGVLRPLPACCARR